MTVGIVLDQKKIAGIPEKETLPQYCCCTFFETCTTVTYNCCFVYFHCLGQYFGFLSTSKRQHGGLPSLFPSNPLLGLVSAQSYPWCIATSRMMGWCSSGINLFWVGT
jgi:hypothetical protein